MFITYMSIYRTWSTIWAQGIWIGIAICFLWHRSYLQCSRMWHLLPNYFLFLWENIIGVFWWLHFGILMWPDVREGEPDLKFLFSCVLGYPYPLGQISGFIWKPTDFRIVWLPFHKTGRNWNQTEKKKNNFPKTKLWSKLLQIGF